MSTNPTNPAPDVSNPPKKDDLTSRLISPDERQGEVIELLQGVMSESDHWSGLELWRWKHVNNPFGESLVIVAEAEDGRIAGLRAFMRWRFRSSDGLVNAYRPVDTATHPDFRRRGIFTKLTLEAIEHSRSQGGGLIFNTPNTMSVSGYLKMGWTQVGVATPALKVRSYPRTAIRIVGSKVRRRLGGKSQPQSSSPQVPDSVSAGKAITPDLEALIEQHNQHEKGQILTDRSVPYLIWRYADNPLYEYAVVTDRQAGILKGAAVVRSVSNSSLDTLVFEELMTAEPGPRHIKRLVDMSFDLFKPDVGSAYAPPGSSMHTALKSTGFRWNSRSRINFVSNPLRPGISPEPSEFLNWSIGMSELEIF